MTFGFDPFSVSCQTCGAKIGDVDRHQVWHDDLAELVRVQVAPDLSPQEWDARRRAAAPDVAARVKAARAAREEQLRQAFNEAVRTNREDHP